MKLFIDTSVLLAAAGSEHGDPVFVFEQATDREWVLITTHYCLEEAKRNVAKVGRKASTAPTRLLVPKLALFSFDKVLSKGQGTVLLLSVLGADDYDLFG